VRALAEVVGTAASDLEALYGLSPMRRLPEAAKPAPRARGSTRPVESLKSQLLRRLLAYPQLAREFEPILTDLLGQGAESVDRQIAEVLAVATSHAHASCAALLEALGDSEFADQYRALCAHDVELDDEVEVVRDEMRDGLLAIEEARVHRELDAMKPLLQNELSDELRERNRRLMNRLSELKQQRVAAGLARS
jgi:hypothetical protein